jgi:AraC-like DNA-binding protein
VYEPSIVIIAQGRKIGYLGDRVFTYDAHNYLVLSVPLPFECETQAKPGEPLLGVTVHVNPSTLAELLLEMDDTGSVAEAVQGIYSNPMTEELTSALLRLLECLSSKTDSRVLGPSIVREIIYRVLCSEQSGGALRAVAARHSSFAQINKVLRRIHTDFSTPIDVETLAREASMSVSTFHHNFRAVTSNSPLQYIKRIRLHRARMLMVQDGVHANIAARQVGYESASQFSREFKRLFGETPAEEAARMRKLSIQLPASQGQESAPR